MQKSTSGSSTKPFWLKVAWPPALLALLVVMAALGCYNHRTGETTIGGAIRFKLPAFPETGAHAVNVFTEMHYQPSYRVQEVPRLLPAPDSVPVTGRAVQLRSLEEYRPLEIPLQVLQTYDAQRAQTLYQVNCQVCHGATLLGDGPMRQYLQGGPLPANLTLDVTRNATNGELFAFVSEGGRQGAAAVFRGRESTSPMPPFKFLLTDEERWTLVKFLRDTIGQ